MVQYCIFKMAAPIVVWVCDELSKLGMDVSEENARYILSMEDCHDLEEYMFELLDKSNPKCRKFVTELLERWKPSMNVPENIQVYQKSFEENSYFYGKEKPKKRSPGKSNLENSITPDEKKTPIVNGLLQLSEEFQEISTTDDKESKKKQKFVPLYSQEGRAKTIIQLPGRHSCECQASKHRLISNCVQCGRVVCEQEGSGPCVFCGELVCTREEQEVLLRGSKKSEKLRQFLTKGDNREFLPIQSSKMNVGLDKAVEHKEKLLEYDKTSVRRTQVIDDESDYFATDSNKWLSKTDREALRKREEELRSKRHASRKDRKITLDFAGRQVLEAEDDTSGLMYDRSDDLVQQIHYGARPKQKAGNAPVLNHIVNPAIQQAAPKFVSPGSSNNRKGGIPTGQDSFEFANQDKRSSVRLQDRELQEMSDEGQCMSVHQPWASLLVQGIKIHEGRTWYTSHRGRLWIAATAKSPTKDDINEVEQVHRCLHNDRNLVFPSQYPVSCLLGCVVVTDCMSQEEYRIKYPDGESASPYVFICEHPQDLVVKFPIKGKHKIYKLDGHIHQGAKKGLRSPTVH